MNDLLAVLAVLYVVLGCAVYALADTSGIASRLESSLVVVPWGVVQRHLFLVVIATWPLFLLYAFLASDGRAE